MTVIDLNSRRKTKVLPLSELCEKFIEKADPVIEAQMHNTLKGRWRLIMADTFLHTAEGVARRLSKPEFAESCKLRRADQMAGFIWRGEYAETVFQLLLDDDLRGSAQQAREKGLENLARALEVERHSTADVLSL